MRKASFILGLIAGIFGIIIAGALLVNGMLMPAIIPGVGSIIAVSLLGLICSIAGIVAAALVGKKKVLSGVIMIVTSLVFILVALNSITGDNILTFVGGLIVFILFLLAGIFGLCIKNNKDEIKVTSNM